MNSAESKFYFGILEEIIADPEWGRFRSVRGRLVCFALFIKRLLVLPFALGFKAYKTIFRLIGVLLGALFVLLTLGISENARNFFLRRASYLSKDFMDWLLLPFALITCLIRLGLASLFHPGLVLA
jgi:hypothetical protein